MAKSIYEFRVKNALGEEVSLEKYRGKVLLIVNTASKCGLTPQLKAMTELYEELKAQTQDFEILAFPSNDFAGQEPLEGQALAEFCSLEYRGRYPVFDKIHVKGKAVHPLYAYLSDKKQNRKVGMPPLWNFQKYLINKRGEVVTYFFPFTQPTANRVKKAILKLLAE
jgi:glutathione peroxidase